MERQSVSSSDIVSIGYDPATETLEIEFRKGVYQYFNVPSVIHESLMMAPSHGIFFHANIKGQFPHERL
jgi:hypothetical protein